MRPRCTGPRSPQEELRLLIERGIGWDRLREAAARHGMLVILAKRLSEYCLGSVPSQVMADLRRLYLQSTAESIRKVGETVRVLRHLRVHGIGAVPLKGSLLSQMVYGDPGLRVSVDVDLLLDGGQVERATDLLSELGYAPALSLDRSQRAALLRFDCEWVFLRGPHRTSVELHWRVVPQWIACGLDVGRPCARARPVEVGGHELPGLRGDDLFLTLCVHGSKHYWDKLEFIYSVAETVRARLRDRLDGSAAGRLGYWLPKALPPRRSAGGRTP